jgi:predicted AAA+ superfamily ATPase
MYQRKQYQEVMSRLQERRRFIQVLAGPRQVGKSTLISQVLQAIDIPYSSHSSEDTPNATNAWITDVWEDARAQIRIHKQTEHLLVIDEIQKIDNWSETIKKEWDRDTREGINLKVVLLGSSRLLLKKGLTESLAGRFEMIRLGHWSYAEMRDAFGFTLDEYIYYGGYPGTADLIHDEERWQVYVRDSLVESAITKDVLLTTTINKPSLLRRLFELGCQYSGRELSLTKMLGELQEKGNVTTLAGYLHLLDECNLLTGLQKYAGDAARKYNSTPKFQVYNNALLNYRNANGFMQERLDSKAWGRQVESAIGTHLLSQADHLGYQVYYWRERNNEVDYVVQKASKLCAIEVKSGIRTTNEGMSRFRDQFHPDLSMIVGTGGTPVEEFLSLDIKELFR